MLAVSEVDSSRYNVWVVHVLAVSEVDSSRYNVWAVHVLAVSEVDSSRYNVWAVHVLAVSEVDSSRYNVWAVHVLAVSEVDSSRYNVWAVHVLAVSEVDSSRYNVWALRVLAVSEVDSSRYNVWAVHMCCTCPSISTGPSSYRLDLTLSTLHLSHHPLFTLEHVLSSQLKLFCRQYTELIDNRVTDYILQRVRHGTCVYCSVSTCVHVHVHSSCIDAATGSTL